MQLARGGDARGCHAGRAGGAARAGDPRAGRRGARLRACGGSVPRRREATEHLDRRRCRVARRLRARGRASAGRAGAAAAPGRSITRTGAAARRRPELERRRLWVGLRPLRMPHRGRPVSTRHLGRGRRRAPVQRASAGQATSGSILPAAGRRCARARPGQGRAGPPRFGTGAHIGGWTRCSRAAALYRVRPQARPESAPAGHGLARGHAGRATRRLCPILRRSTRIQPNTISRPLLAGAVVTTVLAVVTGRLARPAAARRRARDRRGPLAVVAPST